MQDIGGHQGGAGYRGSALGYTKGVQDIGVHNTGALHRGGPRGAGYRGAPKGCRISGLHIVLQLIAAGTAAAPSSSSSSPFWGVFSQQPPHPRQPYLLLSCLCAAVARVLAFTLLFLLLGTLLVGDASWGVGSPSPEPPAPMVGRASVDAATSLPRPKATGRRAGTAAGPWGGRLGRHRLHGRAGEGCGGVFLGGGNPPPHHPIFASRRTFCTPTKGSRCIGSASPATAPSGCGQAVLSVTPPGKIGWAGGGGNFGMEDG